MRWTLFSSPSLHLCPQGSVRIRHSLSRGAGVGSHRSHTVCVELSEQGLAQSKCSVNGSAQPSPQG